MRSSVSDQPSGPKRCWTAISTLWHIRQRMTSSQPGVCGSCVSCAGAAPPTAVVSASPAASTRARGLCDIDLHGVDDIPAVAEAVPGPGGGLDAAQTVSGARHERVAAPLRIPVELPASPRIAVPRSGEPAGGPGPPTVGGDIDARQLAFTGPGPPPDRDATRLSELGAVGRLDDERLHLERLERVDLLVVVHARRRVVGLHVEAVELIGLDHDAVDPFDGGRGDEARDERAGEIGRASCRE